MRGFIGFLTRRATNRLVCMFLYQLLARKLFAHSVGPERIACLQPSFRTSAGVPIEVAR
jgi:hypothetical protein